MSSRHTFEEIIFLLPHRCQGCGRTLWGSESPGVRCSECRMVFHSSCSEKDLKCRGSSVSAKNRKTSGLERIFQRAVISAETSQSDFARRQTQDIKKRKSSVVPLSADQKKQYQRLMYGGEPPPALTCPITQQLMLDPVRASDGYLYDRSSIEKWLEDNGTSPLNREEMSSKLEVDHEARRRAKEFRDVFVDECRMAASVLSVGNNDWKRSLRLLEVSYAAVESEAPVDLIAALIAAYEKNEKMEEAFLFQKRYAALLLRSIECEKCSNLEKNPILSSAPVKEMLSDPFLAYVCHLSHSHPGPPDFIPLVVLTTSAETLTDEFWSSMMPSLIPVSSSATEMKFKIDSDEAAICLSTHLRKLKSLKKLTIVGSSKAEIGLGGLAALSSLIMALPNLKSFCLTRYSIDFHVGCSLGDCACQWQHLETLDLWKNKYVTAGRKLPDFNSIENATAVAIVLRILDSNRDTDVTVDLGGNPIGETTRTALNRIAQDHPFLSVKLF